jgi:hypothetical protein
MFGRSRPIVLEPHGGRRSRKLLPRWLVLLLVGIALGAAAVIYVQERHLPPRLSAQAAAELRSAFNKAEAERVRLTGELDATTKQLAGALAEKKALADELGEIRATTAQLREDVKWLVAALPPDPRGGDIEVRAARFEAKDGSLAYDVVLTRERAQGKPLAAVMQLVVEGQSAGAGPNNVSLEPVAISVGDYANLRGSLPMPEGFQARQTTIQLLDRVGGKQLGRRVLFVN